VCKKCKVEKPLSEYWRYKRSGVWKHQGSCSQCTNEYQRRWKEGLPPPEQWLEYTPLPPRPRKSQRRSDSRALTERERTLLKYNLTPAQFNTMLEAQNGVCALCEKTSKSKRSLHVDHDHETGEVRGLLCFSCNSKLGWAERIGLARIVAYLKGARR
jgi:hypothetical protein